MADPDLVSATDAVIEMLNNILFISVVSCLALFLLYRLLYYILIQRGGKEKLDIWINNSDTVRNIIFFFNPTSEFLKETEDTPEVLKEKANIKIIRSDSGQTKICYREDEILFDGQRALIIWFFYKNQNSAKTYNDYNGWIKNLGKKKEDIIDYRVFRQEIEDINGRLNKESNNIAAITQKSQTNYKIKGKPSSFRYRPQLK